MARPRSEPRLCSRDRHVYRATGHVYRLACGPASPRTRRRRHPVAALRRLAFGPCCSVPLRSIPRPLGSIPRVPLLYVPRPLASAAFADGRGEYDQEVSHHRGPNPSWPGAGPCSRGRPRSGGLSPGAWGGRPLRKGCESSGYPPSLPRIFQPLTACRVGAASDGWQPTGKSQCAATSIERRRGPGRSTDGLEMRARTSGTLNVAVTDVSLPRSR